MLSQNHKPILMKYPTYKNNCTPLWRNMKKFSFMEEQKPTQTFVDEVIERAQSENTKIEATKIYLCFKIQI